MGHGSSKSGVKLSIDARRIPLPSVVYTKVPGLSEAQQQTMMNHSTKYPVKIDVAEPTTE